MAQQEGAQRQAVIEEEARASIFGFPLVLMDVTRQVVTGVAKVDEKLQKAPVNQLSHMRAFPDATFTDVVSPNADTLYSVAFLDLKDDAVVLSVPEMGERYYLFQMLDAWTNVFAAPGTRTTGNREQSFAIVGPAWRGTLPEGLRRIDAPTTMVALIGRTQTNGKADYSAVHAIQDRYRLTPLRSWGTDYEPAEVPVPPGIDVKTAPVAQVERMDGEAFFARLNALMKDNPPSPADAESMFGFARIGIAPGRSFDSGSVDRAIVQSAEEGAREGLERITAEARRPHGQVINGWERFDAGRYGTDYLLRAVVALGGLGANLPEDAVYPHTTHDADGQLLTGASRYEITFPRGGLPPVRAFWSVTLYDEKHAFAANPIDRYALGDRDPLIVEEDGSVTLYIQSESPGPDQASNWLPAPEGPFSLIMRLYWPKEEVVSGRWRVPPVRRVGGA